MCYLMYDVMWLSVLTALMFFARSAMVWMDRVGVCVCL
jgi:hypothetical protein